MDDRCCKKSPSFLKVVFASTIVDGGRYAIRSTGSGRARARSFGQPSDGRSTSNEAIALPDGGTLLLSTAVFADRDASDPVLAAAQAWLVEGKSQAR
ncbi:hypothetical protein ASD86_21245 [Lysobacter sp. Root690]|nr:hypothetical protein ASD86_21245 [Lysobacter sp. Root690]